MLIKRYLEESEKASHKMQESIIHVSGKELISSIYNEFLQINKKKTIRKQQNELNTPFKMRVFNGSMNI